MRGISHLHLALDPRRVVSSLALIVALTLVVGYMPSAVFPRRVLAPNPPSKNPSATQIQDQCNFYCAGVPSHSENTRRNQNINFTSRRFDVKITFELRRAFPGHLHNGIPYTG